MIVLVVKEAKDSHNNRLCKMGARYAGRDYGREVALVACVARGSLK